MLQIKKFKVRKTTLDFTSSGGGIPEVSQLLFNDVIFMNAIEYVEFEEDAVQLNICDHCGTIGCSSGDWVSFRKSGDYILLIPVFELTEKDEWNGTEYAPPSIYDKETRKRKKDTPYFDLETYGRLRKKFPNFPSIDKIKHLKMREAVRLVQYNMPLRLFGTPPEVFLSQTIKKSCGRFK